MNNLSSKPSNFWYYALYALFALMQAGGIFSLYYGATLKESNGIQVNYKGNPEDTRPITWYSLGLFIIIGSFYLAMLIYETQKAEIN
jgi:hypothetical protein